MRWQPKETAPKDGTDVLGCALWRRGGKSGYSWICDGYFDENGDWYFASLDPDFIPADVTHWMPMLEKPDAA